MSRALKKRAAFPLQKWKSSGEESRKGLHIADIHYDELQKTMLLMVVEDEHKDKVIQTIMESARTGKYGDGRIFVNPVEEAYTIRTGKARTLNRIFGGKSHERDYGNNQDEQSPENQGRPPWSAAFPHLP